MATISKYYKKDVTDAIAAKTLKCVLLLNTFTLGAGHANYAAISAWEVVGAGYTAGGKALTTLASTQVGDNAKFSADNVQWTGLTVTARYAAIYDTVSGRVISEHDLGGDKAVSGGTLTLTWNASGILTVS